MNEISKEMLKHIAALQAALGEDILDIMISPYGVNLLLSDKPSEELRATLSNITCEPWDGEEAWPFDFFKGTLYPDVEIRWYEKAHDDTEKENDDER